MKVRVGSGVSEGRGLGVPVAEGVNVSVGEGAGEGVRLDVQVGIAVGVAGLRMSSPPQAMRTRARMDIPRRVFGNLLQRMIQVPEDPQALQGEPGRDDLDHIRFLGNDRREPAGGNDFHVIPQLLTEAVDHPLHHADVTE